MFTSLRGCHKQATKYPKLQGKCQLAAQRVLFNSAPQAVKETLEACEFATNFHRFHIDLLKHFSTQFKNQNDSVSLIKTLFLLLIN